MSRVIAQAGLKDPGKERKDWDAVPVVALQALEMKKPQAYRAVLIDEAQDFTTDMLRFCTGLFQSADSDEQDLLVVADNAQNIFSRKFTWKAAGIAVTGRSTVMRTNYRNTREILEFAHTFLADDPEVEVDEDDIEGMSIIPAKATERTGSTVSVTLVDNDGDQLDRIEQQVQNWLASSGDDPRSIAVLMQSEKTKKFGEQLAQRLMAKDVGTFWVGDPSDPKAKDQVGFTDAPVVLSTVHSSKGLEFPRVIVTGLINGHKTDVERRVRDRKLLYVGFTRAVDDLVVIAKEDDGFAASLKKAEDAQR